MLGVSSLDNSSEPFLTCRGLDLGAPKQSHETVPGAKGWFGPGYATSCRDGRAAREERRKALAIAIAHRVEAHGGTVK